MKKAAIYCRLSEEDKNKLCATDDSGSIQNQKAMLVQYAEEQGWEVYQIYSDCGTPPAPSTTPGD